MSTATVSRKPDFAMSAHVRNGMHTVGTNLLQVASVLTITVLVARRLGPEGKGVFDLFITTAQLFSTVLGLSLPSGITYVVASGRADLRRLENAGLLLASVQCAVCFPIVYLLERLALLPQVLPAASGNRLTWMVLLGVNVGLVALSSQYRAILIGKQSFRSANLGDLVKQAANLGLLGIAVLGGGLAGPSAAGLVAVASTGAVVFAMMAYRSAIDNRDARSAAGSGIRESVRYSLPCAASNLVQFLNYRFGVYFVNAYAGAAALGLYQTASFVAQSLTILPGAVAAITFPAVANGFANGRDKAAAAAQCARLILWISILCGALLAALAPAAIPVFFGRRFQESIPVLLVLLPAVVVFCPAQVLASYLAGAGKPHLNFGASAAGALLTVLLNRWWVPSYGILGAAAGTAVAQTVNACLLRTFFVRASGQSGLFLPTRPDAELICNIVRRSKRRLYGF